MWAFWWRHLLLAGGLAGLFILLWASHGLLAGLIALVLLLLGYLGRHLWYLSRLFSWLQQPDGAAPPGRGVWADILYLLDKQMRQRRLGQQTALDNLEQLLQATRFLPDGIVILDAKERIAWLNDAAERYLGLSRARDVGQFIYYLLRNSRFTEWLTLDDPSSTLSMRSPALAGYSLTLKKVALPRGQRMLLCHDITELERVDAMRRDFVANVSHELRTPITVIAGFLEAFADMEMPAPEEFKKHVHLMCEQSERIRRLLDDLLVLARLEGEEELQNETVDVPTLIQQLLSEARSLSQGRHEIQLRLDSQARLIGRGQELHSAFGNLVSNAVRYTPAGGRITLRWAVAESKAAEFSVSDTGEGIEPQHIPRLTERFYRVDRGRSRATGGTGLGLAIVKHVLQRHQGRLRVESVVGKGSAFTCVLPADRVIPGVAADATPSPAPVAP